MAFAKLSFLLALFCGIASASWGPHGLVADVDNSKGDFADLKVQWTAGDCPFSDFALYSQAPGGDRVKETYTSDTSFRIVNKEFWTNYTLTLDTWYCFVEKPLISHVYTGPGNPHKVTGVETASSIVDANVTIQEAIMPRPVEQYNVTWCSPKSCQTKMFARNSRGPPGKFDFTLNGLTPNTSYYLTVVPELSFEGKAYRGPAYTSEFVTKNIHLPGPSEINLTLPWEATKHQEVNITWKLDKSPYDFAFFTVDVTSSDDPTLAMHRNVTEPEVLFDELPTSVQMKALITAFFNVSGQLLHGKPGSIVFHTPDLDPQAGNFTYENLDETTIYAEWGSSLHLPPNSVEFNFAYTNTKTNVSVSLNVTEPWIRLGNLSSNTTYEVAISVLSVVMGSNVLQGEFKTLDKDYATPVDFEVTPLSQTEDKVSYNLSWVSDIYPKKASKFQIKSCERTSQACFLNHTTQTQIVVPFDYFANYDLTVTAVYRLKFNKTQIRQSQKFNVQTPGTELSEVTNIKLQRVTSEDAVLVWTAPENVPKNLKRNYKIFGAANNLINQTGTEMIQLVSLAPYSYYEINIQASVMYNNTEFSSNSTNFGFYSDSAAPGAPDAVETEQIIRTNAFKVFWTEPKIANGQLDYYEVLVSDSEGEVVSNLTNLVGTKSSTVTLHSAHSDANYTVNVRAVNVNLQNATLPGNWSESTLLFKGIDPPTAELFKRSSDSLTFKVTPSNTTTDMTGLFYSLKNGNNSFSDSSDQIEVKNLPVYTDATVEVYACYLPTFCSEPFNITERTNVAGPTQVRSLRGDFTNKTVPFINWTEPDVLNGPLNGYLVQLTDLTNSSLKIADLVPANQTSYVYETTLEFEKYNFTVVGYNLDLDDEKKYLFGEESNTMVNTTGDHAPKPENVQELNKTSTSASFHWEKPEYPGFNVTYYFIEVPSLKIAEMTNETTFTLGGLKPWTKIQVWTSGCETENVTTCGQPGAYDITTSVDKPSEPLSISFTNVTDTEALVSWKEPSTPNGPITGYKIAVTESDNQNLTWNHVEEKAAVHKLTNLTADTKYTVHLLAYNVDDDTGEELASPASMADFKTTSTGGFPWWILAVAVVVVAAGAVAGTVIYRRRKMQGDDREQLVQA